MPLLTPVQLADGVWRCGSTLINWYLVEDAGRVTVVDAGLPRHRRQLDAALAAAGRTVGDVAAIVLTHGHPDHLGFAEALRREAGVPVLVHAADAALARKGRPGRGERPIRPYLRHRGTWEILAESLTGGLPKPVQPTSTFADGAELDVPGQPRVIHAPGHSPGSVALHFARHDVLLVGDVLCTRNPLTTRPGPQVMPGAVNVSTAQALASLARLDGVEAAVLAPGHGHPWRRGVAAALAAARENGPS